MIFDMSEPFVKDVDFAVRSRFRQLVNRCLGNDDFAQKLLDSELREGALKDFGLEGEELEMALAALNEVDLGAIENFRNALQIGVAIPI